MKQNPKDVHVVDDLRAGILARDGFLGEDQRPFQQIITDDAATLAALHTNAVELAQHMETLTKAGLPGMGEWVIAGAYEVKVEEFMGKIGCPFRDHRAPKRNTTARHSKTGQEIAWTDLGLHLIGKHGFFQGVGSAYRVEPQDLAAFFQLEQ